jgi:hypothetical protein
VQDRPHPDLVRLLDAALAASGSPAARPETASGAPRPEAASGGRVGGRVGGPRPEAWPTGYRPPKSWVQ